MPQRCRVGQAFLDRPQIGEGRLLGHRADHRDPTMPLCHRGRAKLAWDWPKKLQVGSLVGRAPCLAIKWAQVIARLGISDAAEGQGKALGDLAVGRGEGADLEPEAVWLWAGHLL